MKQYHILKTFSGSQTGTDTDRFEAGTTRQLSDSLARAIGGTAGGFIKDVEALQPAKPETRETKVVTPAETKVDAPDETKVTPEETKVETPEKSLDEMNFNELKIVAKAKGIKLFGMSEAKLRAALQPA